MVVREAAWGLVGSFQDTVTPRPSLDSSTVDALAMLVS